MIQIVPQMRLLVAVQAIDFGNGIDGLARICKQALESDVFFRLFVRFSKSPTDGHKNTRL